MKCPRCNSDKLIKAGKDYIKSGALQRYHCKNCNMYTIKPIGDVVINTTS